MLGTSRLVNQKCGSVDTLDCPPPPALPPRRPPWPPNRQLSCNTLRNIEAVGTTGATIIGGGGGGGGSGAAGTTSTSGTARSSCSKINSQSQLINYSGSGSLINTGTIITPIGTPIIASGCGSGRFKQGLRCHQTPPPPPSLVPPQYPAPPRPPSRNGGDEVRVAKAGNNREDTISNGTTSTPTLSAPPPRTGWAVRTPTGLTSSSTTATSSPLSVSSLSTSSSSSSTSSLQGVQRSEWVDRAAALSSSSSPSVRSANSVVRQQVSSSSSTIHEQPPLVSSVSGANSSTLTTPVLTTHHTAQSNGRWPERLDLRLPPMSSQNGPLSRPPSSASSGGGTVITSPSTSNLPARVHGHDHTRPLPPPRLPETISTIAPLTAPLTPLSTSSSFRMNSRFPSMNTTPTTTSSGDSSTQLRNDRTLGEVTLTVPRPDIERIVNEYVETPFRQPSNHKCLKNERRQQQNQPHHHHHHHHLPQQSQQRQPQQQQQLPQNQQLLNEQQQTNQQSSHEQQRQHQQIHEHKNVEARTARRHQSNLLQSSASQHQPVTKQPVSFTKEPANTGSGSLGRPNDTSLSIMCDYCGKCRCESCREPPPLPSRWLCNNSCFCSAETALDYASCLCCVKGLFYHCGDANGNSDSEAGGSCADEPCSCVGSRKAARWTCLAALTMVLPCLLCYWPLKGCVKVCEACYARHAAQGCKCDPTTVGRSFGGPPGALMVSRDSRDPEKRLLDPITPDLS